jgi:cytochrome c-type biogenesis protein CcmH
MIVLFLALILGAPQGTPLTGAALDQKTYEVASLLRCPVCQGMSVADSPSTVALDMKRQVRELLARGYTQEQVLSSFEESYGQFVLLKPKFRGVNALVWILPILVLLGGAALVITKAKKLEAPTTNDRQPTTDDPYISRVRELAEKE